MLTLIASRESRFKGERVKSSNIMFKHLTQDTFHFLLTCRWLTFLSLLISSFFFVNLGFSLVYVSFTDSFYVPDHLTHHSRFVSGLFLSVQTMSTIGYGGLIPKSIAGELIAAVESLVGLTFTALSTGFIFSRLSRPSAQIRFANVFLHTEAEYGPALVFRVANERGNDIINAEATLSCLDLTQTTPKLNMLQITDLKLRRSRTPTFYLNWMLVHDLTPDSPLAHYSVEALSRSTMIYILNITGHDSSFNELVFQYQRFDGSALKPDAYFKDMIIYTADGQPRVNLENLSQWVPAQSTSQD